LSAHELRGVPGTGYRYSNVGYGLLGHALARAVRMSDRDLMRDRVFLPLGMNDSDEAHLLRRPLSFTFRPDAGGAGVALFNADDARSRKRESTTRSARKVAAEMPSPARVAGWTPAPAGQRGGPRRPWLWVVAALAVAASFGAMRARSARRAEAT
jgi:CubicO group peptidase (beta-lactamase class C family)